MPFKIVKQFPTILLRTSWNISFGHFGSQFSDFQPDRHTSQAMNKTKMEPEPVERSEFPVEFSMVF